MSATVSDVIQPIDPPSNYPAPVSYVRRMAAWLRTVLYTKPDTGIPESDLSDSVKGKLNKDIWVHEPATEGTNGQVLATDGDGGRSWIDTSAAINEYLKKAEIDHVNKTLELTSVGGTSKSVSIGSLGGLSELSIQNLLKDKSNGESLYPVYEQKAYSVGDVVFYEGKLYKCSSAIPSEEPWTSAHWTETSVGSEKANKSTTIAGYGITDAKIENGTITLGSGTITPVTDVSGKVNTSDIVNNADTGAETAGKVLDARMGKTLNDKITSLSNRGRYLSLWDCSTGLAKTNPDVSPYTYKTGDYFIVGSVNESQGGTNYRPSGDKYVIGTASTAVESGEVSPNDTYCYDGSEWTLLRAPSAVVSFANLSGSPSDNQALSTALGGKVNTSDVVTPSSSTVTGKAADAKSVYDNFASKATTIQGYGITDAKIENGVVTLGTHTVTPMVDPGSGTVGDVLKKTNSGIEWGLAPGSGISEWAATTAYVSGQAVTHDRELFYCKTAHTSRASWDTEEQAYWNSTLNAVMKTGEASQVIEGSITVGSVYVGGTRVEVVSEIPASPIANTLYFILGT